MPELSDMWGGAEPFVAPGEIWICNGTMVAGGAVVHERPCPVHGESTTGQVYVELGTALKALASLTTERDRLREERDRMLTDLELAESDLPGRLRVSLLQASVRRVTRERDTAQALLVEEQRDHAVTREALRRRSVTEFGEPCGDELGRLVCTKARGHDTHWNGAGTVWRHDRDPAVAELERQRPVIEAAPLLWAFYEAWGNSASVEPTSEQMDAGWVELISLEDSKRLDLAFSAIDNRAAEIYAALVAVDALPSPTPTRTWSLPPEPGLEVTRVLDAYGQYFERQHDEHPGDDVWIGQTFAAELDVPDLELEWPMLMAYQAPLTDATPKLCSTCTGTGAVHCAAHIAGDGCDNLTLKCPDCTPGNEDHPSGTSAAPGEESGA